MFRIMNNSMKTWIFTETWKGRMVAPIKKSAENEKMSRRF